MWSTAHLVASFSSTKKPRSANTQSPWVSLSRKPGFKVISLSEALCPQPAERKLTAPAGVIPIKYLIVLWDLQFENVYALAFKLRGRSIYISVQSVMQTQFLKELKHAGRFSLNASLSDQTIRVAKTLADFGNQVLASLNTYSSFILNLKERSRLLAPSLSFTKIRRRWSLSFTLV